MPTLSAFRYAHKMESTDHKYIIFMCSSNVVILWAIVFERSITGLTSLNLDFGAPH